MSWMAGIVLSIVCSVPSGEEIRQAQRVVLSNASYQRELPGHAIPTREAQPTGREPPAWEEPPRGRRRVRTTPMRNSGRGRPVDIRGELETDVDGNAVGRALAWTLLAALGLVLLAALVRNLRGYTPNVRRTDTPGGTTAPAPLALTRPLSESERLAGEGSYGEAIHILLLETLSELGTRIPGSVQRSWTSREILARSELGADALSSLSLLVKTVEQSLFGHATAGPTDYQRSREAFDAFAQAVRRGGRAA